MSVHDLTNLLRLDLSREELILVSNALNEVCNGIDFTDDEFHTRIGGSREKALKCFGGLLQPWAAIGSRAPLSCICTTAPSARYKPEAPRVHRSSCPGFTRWRFGLVGAMQPRGTLTMRCSGPAARGR